MRGRSLLPFIAVAAGGVFGAWLMGMFETGEPAREVSGRDNLVSVAGFFLFMGSIVVSGFLLRRVLPPITRAEMVAWGDVRERGRSRFVREAAARGLRLGLISLAGIILWNYLRGETNFGRFGAQEVILYAALLLIMVFAAWYAAVRDWAVKEEAYNKLIGDAPAADDRVETTGR
jgi:hypothetical protein